MDARDSGLINVIIRGKCFQVAEEILASEPRVKIFLFGSRALGTASSRSDIDLGIDIGRPIPPEKIVLLREVFYDLPILQKVDLVDFSLVDSDFREVAMKGVVTLYERKIA